MALTNWMVASGELQANYEYGVALNGKQLGGGVANQETLRQTLELKGQIADLLTDQINRLAFSHRPALHRDRRPLARRVRGGRPIPGDQPAERRSAAGLLL